jgi:F-type H+-transporting ATPase subunit epsilon
VRLTIATPSTVVAALDDVAALRAEDDSGSFGILPGHAELIAALVPSVLSWHDVRGAVAYCAVRGGVLTVRRDHVAVATPEAVRADDLARLEHDVVRRFREAAAEEGSARSAASRLHVAAIRRILDYVRAERPAGAPGLRPPAAESEGA